MISLGRKFGNCEILIMDMALAKTHWQTSSVRELDRLAKFFGVSISVFFADSADEENERMATLLRATGELREPDFNELVEYANFRAARRRLANAKKKRESKKNERT